jgi:hypothetical protein
VKFMNADIVKKGVNTVSEELTVLLLPIGFAAVRYETTTNSMTSWKRWVREVKWKRDIVDLEYPKPQFTEDVGFSEVHFRLDLRYEDEDEGPFDGVTVSGLRCQQASGRYYFPITFLRSGERVFNRYAATLVEHTRESLDWFNERATPQQCLSKLLTGETGVGHPEEIPAAKKALEFLRRCEGCIKPEKG